MTSGIKKKLLSVRHYKAGYDIRTEEWRVFEDEEPTIMKAAYTTDGNYIGSSKVAYRLCVQMGISPELRTENSSVCSIGFSEREQKWHGWSHRCICSFGIGDKLFEEQYGDDYTLFTQHGSITIETLEQAKQAASAFAGSVS